MRDNLNIEELSDQAWHNMSVMLDQEMPLQDGRRKRPFFWWLFGAGILLAVLVVLFQWSTNAALPEPQIKSLPIPQRMVAENSGVETKFEAEKTTKTPNSEASTTVSKTNKISNTETRRPENLKSIVNTKTNKEEALQLATQRPVNSNSTLDPKLVDNTTPEIPTFQNEPAKVAEVPAVQSQGGQQQEVTETPRVKPASISVDAIPGLPIEPFSIEELSIAEFEQYTGKSSPFTFELGAGLISKNLDGINGAFTELRSGLRLGKHSKFSLINGIGLHYQREPFLIDMKSQRGANFDNAISTPTMDQQGGGMTNTPVGQQEAVKNLSELVASSDIQVSSLFLDVPIALNWQFAPRWSFELGGRVSWQFPRSLSTTSSSSESTFAQSSGDPAALDTGSRNQFAFYQPTSNNSAAVTTLTMRNWNLATTAAVNFKLNPKWTLRLQYQYGLTNRLDDSSYQMLDRTLWLGLGRRF